MQQKEENVGFFVVVFFGPTWPKKTEKTSCGIQI